MAQTLNETDSRRRVTQHQLNTVRDSFLCVEPCGAAFISHALQRVCVVRPNISAVMHEGKMAVMSQRLFDTLRAVVQNADRFHTLEQALGQLGARAERMGLTTADLLAAKDELMRCLRDACAERWTRQCQNAWTLLLDAVVGALAAGAIAYRELHGQRSHAAA